MFKIKQGVTIYHAASLFNGRETLFNQALTHLLSKKGYNILLPQRDGFDFDNMARLIKSLEQEHMPSEEVTEAVDTIIYLLDIGIYIPKSQVVIANLDEPLDPGVDVELCYANMMDKLIVGFRTDIRIPFGSNDYRGMHFFPTYQCDVFITHNMPAMSVKSSEEEMDGLVEKIDGVIKHSAHSLRQDIPKYALNHPKIKKVLDGADILFGGVEDIHSDEGLKEICRRYTEYKKSVILDIGPSIV